jgi:hypothetical protein
MNPHEQPRLFPIAFVIYSNPPGPLSDWQECSPDQVQDSRNALRKESD